MKYIISLAAGIAIVASLVGGAVSNAQAYSYPYGGLTCSPSAQSVQSGDQVNFSAYFAYTAPQYPYSQLTWQAVGGSPSTGTGTGFSTRFYTASITQTSVVSVTNGTETANCTVYINGVVSTPTPTPAIASLSLVEYGRNIAQGQSMEDTAVVGRGNETIELVLHVKNTGNTTLSNVRVNDLLPLGVWYLPTSTGLNGTLIADGITNAGLNIGALIPSQEDTVKFSVMIDPNSVPTRGKVTVQNIAQVRADGINTVSAPLPITLQKYLSLVTIAKVKTGPADSILLSLLISTMVTSLCAVYMTAERKIKKDGLNFLR